MTVYKIQSPVRLFTVLFLLLAPFYIMEGSGIPTCDSYYNVSFSETGKNNPSLTGEAAVLVFMERLAGLPDEPAGNKPSWKDITTVEDVWALYPERIRLIFNNIDLNSEGLERVKREYENGNMVQASKYLLDHYKKSDMITIVSRPVAERSDRSVAAADSIMEDIITVQRVTDRVPRLASGHIDWHHRGPHDDREYAWLFNRHSAVGTLLRAWFETGNPKYAEYIDFFIRDWIISSWPYPEVRSSTAMWRGLEVTARVRGWMPAFFSLLDTGYLTPATQLLILSSLPEHTHYLRNFHAGGNWLTMEMNGLATVATSWPEFRDASEWLDYSISAMTNSLQSQVYPDGVQSELTSHYHYVALRNFDAFKNICDRVGVTLPEFYTSTLEAMYNYMAGAMRPDGHGPLNNNSDLFYNREAIKGAAADFSREDWLYIATNSLEGVKPQEGPSFFFPWAGQLISRSDYGPDAHWSYFDIGPWGTAHQHNDKLHLSIAAYGHDLLVDAGRFAYVGSVADKFRDYARGSQSHNLLLIDGKGQSPGPRRTDEPLPGNRYLITDDFDYASEYFDDFDGLEGEARHTRSLFYVRGEFWVVVDHLDTDRPRQIQALWHWHPSVSVREQENGVVASTNRRGNLKIVPAGNASWDIDIVRGQDEPEIQGWYSREYNMYEPNTATIYSSGGTSGSTYAWVLFPFEKFPPEVKAEILSNDPGGVKVRVSVEGKGVWNIDIPFLNNAEARMEFVPER